MSVFDVPPKHSRIWTYPTILKKMIALKKKGGFKWFTYGKSGEGRNLWYTKFGNGPKKIMILCRQHGTEYTSTHSMIHMMNSMVLHPEEWKHILNSLQIIIIPVYNPDGAIYYDWVRNHGFCLHYKIMGIANLTTGRTLHKLNIDPNRDHKKQKWPETKAFAKLMDEFKPDLFLDLHNFGFASNFFLVPRKEQRLTCAYPLVDHVMDPNAKPLQLKALKIAHIVQEGIRNGGLLPGKINGLYPHIFNMDAVLKKIGLASNYYLVEKKIPSITIETMGDFGMGDIFIHQSVPSTILAVKSVLNAMVEGKI